LYRLNKLLLKQIKLPELRDNQFCFNSAVYYTYNHFTWTVEYRTTGILGLLIKFLTVYLCITFHFFALALGGKGVFYSYKKILMLHFCNWKKNALWSRMFVLEKLSLIKIWVKRRKIKTIHVQTQEHKKCIYTFRQ
jgi:hypothetical protein